MPDESTSLVVGGPCEVSLCAAAIELNGARFVPDDSTAYVEFKLSHSFPVVNCYGDCLHPATIGRSYQSLQHKPVNFRHLMRSYDPDSIHRDRVLGAVVAVSYPQTAHGAWPPPADAAAAPGVRAVASLFKMADGMDRILGAFQANRTAYTVSMEVRYYHDESGFLVQTEPTAGNLAPGWDYFPLGLAPLDLLATRDFKRNRMTTRLSEVAWGGEWQGRRVWWMMGGPSGTNHYRGVGIVEMGAEPTAAISHLLAAHEELAAWTAVEGALEVALRSAGNLLTNIEAGVSVSTGR